LWSATTNLASPWPKPTPTNTKPNSGYDTRGNELSETDPLGHKTSFEYGSRNYLIATSEPLGVATECGYDANGDLISIKPRAAT
jgi:YD repeat-containing protein